MNWIDEIKNVFRPPSAEVIAVKELENAKRSLLEAQSAAEYANRMTQWHQDRIKRLQAYVKDTA